MSELIVLQNCATIQLTRGQNTLIDADDWPEFSRRKWFATPYPGGFYAARRGPRRTYIHREIVGTPDGMVTDHANGDGLDNRRANLRACSQAENLANRRKNPDGYTSQWKGVCRDDKRRMPWKATIFRNGKLRLIGRFKYEYEAAIAYNEVARELDGPYARLNDVDAPPMYHI